MEELIQKILSMTAEELKEFIKQSAEVLKHP